MDLTKLKKQPVIVAMVVGFVLIVMFGAGLSRKDNPIPTQPNSEAAVEQPVQPVGLAAIKSHTVVEGETLGGIAEKYHIDVDTLLGANPDASEILHPGDQLVILPQKGVLHAVSDGDTLWRIASVYGVEIAAILSANDKKSEGLAIGEKLFIPGAKPVDLGELPSANIG
ncbi:LysM peptidoglycan-binding domain-containing protein [bacterium BFN5]|nr:LysM peptidoglycan-binding domain-containing protein [bacterium BFN5]